MLQAQPYALVQFVAAPAGLLIGALAWRRRHAVPSMRYVVLLSAGLVQWSLSATAAACFDDLDLQVAFTLGFFPGVSVVALGFYLLCRRAVDRDFQVTRRSRLVVGAAPTLVTLLAVTNPWHGWVISSARLIGRPAMLEYHVGPGYWAHTVYCYGLMSWGLNGVLRGALTRTSALQRRQLVTLLAASGLPLAGNIWTVSHLGRGAVVDLTLPCFVLTAAIAGWATAQTDVLRLDPVARAVVLDRMQDAVLVVDTGRRLLDLNPAAERLLRLLVPDLPARLTGVPWHELRFPAAAREPDRQQLRVGGLPGDGIQDGEYWLQAGGRAMAVDIRSSVLRGRRGDPIGWVVVVRDITELRTRERELAATNARLETMNQQLRGQLETIGRLQADLAEQAVRDALTGLHNRRHLLSALAADISRGRVTGVPLAVILLDIDHFKQVNDRHGHHVGDDLLIAVAGALAGAMRVGDTLARYGGEEFVAVLIGLEQHRAWARADELRKQCAAVAVPSESGPVRTTISAGVATSQTVGYHPELLLRAADEALYRAKAEGRNRVLLAGPPSMPPEPRPVPV
ncbi:MAG TPA: diguanylate cyclase [Kineosporiaceae bacterium]